MIDILLHGLDNETRMKLLPREQDIIKNLSFREGQECFEKAIQTKTVPTHTIKIATDR